MAPILDPRPFQSPLERTVNWHGRSGHAYMLRPVPLDGFALENDDLYLIARGSLVLWAGSSEDVINDAQSRARFRLALDCADRAFHVEVGSDQVERMTVIWDLEGAEPQPGQVAA
jgi:hypothetical protein